MDDLLRSMNRQLRPSPSAMASLRARLEAEKARVETSAAPKTGPMRPHFFRNFGALAACAALLLCAWPAYQALRPAAQATPAPGPETLGPQGFSSSDAPGVSSPLPVSSELPAVSAPPSQSLETLGPQGIEALKLHSFVLAEAGAIGNYSQEITVATGSGDTGDRDKDMTPDELAQALGDAGFSQSDIDEYQAIGYQMTWAKWWKFYHSIADAGDPFTLDALKTFSQKELHINTGALPGDAYEGDAAVQEEAAAAYQALMARFRADFGEDAYPDWYGGSYIDKSGTLVISVTQEVSAQADKAFFLEVQDWAGSDKVAFREVKYSLTHLNALMDRLNALPETDPKCGDVMAGWGVDERGNRIELTLTGTDDHILSVLAELDPEDDAILVQVAANAATTYDTAPAQVQDLPDKLPGGALIGEEPIAVEPQVGKEPQPGGLTAAPHPGAVANAVTEPRTEPARTDLDGTVPYDGEPIAVEPQGEPASASEDGQIAQADNADTPAAAVSHSPGDPSVLPQSKLPAVVSE